ncbi:hypothetical protein K505DRAFT_132580 [Melanomma pulvis-pyrius CBS 109.77]|uniref:Uncharacterized protein n=1 Tax=Melanomma pulvis-pyrius CBS 109.77 TaxID=1314802 RepID=A0A6A6XNQ2_9PLEO|nr:hypothetical protein K505DRAFT_132580 [Melanomma pulvis-pyrius CBS 109.77]
MALLLCTVPPAFSSACLKSYRSLPTKVWASAFSPLQHPYPITLHSDSFLYWHFLYRIHTPSTLCFVTKIPFSKFYSISFVHSSISLHFTWMAI